MGPKGPSGESGEADEDARKKLEAALDVAEKKAPAFHAVVRIGTPHALKAEEMSSRLGLSLRFQFRGCAKVEEARQEVLESEKGASQVCFTLAGFSLLWLACFAFLFVSLFLSI